MNKGLKIIGVLLLGIVVLILSSYTRTFKQEYFQFPILIILFGLSGWLLSRFYKKIWPYPFLILLPTLISLIYAFIINKMGIVHYTGETLMIVPAFFIGFYFSRWSAKRQVITATFLVIFYSLYISKLNPELVYYNSSVQVNKDKGKPLPNFQFINPDSSLLMLDKYKGNVMLIDFYFNNCSACIKKMYALEKIQTNYRGNSNFTLLMVHRGGSETFSDFLQKLYGFPKNLTYVYDSLSAASKKLNLDATGYPVELIIDKKGIIRETVLGFNHDLDLVYQKNTIKIIDALLNEKN